MAFRLRIKSYRAAQVPTLMEKEPLLSSSTSTATVATSFLANADVFHEATSTESVAIGSPTSTVLTRLSAILTLAAIALWANREASKVFDLSIVNSAAASSAGRLFDIMFISNGRANRIVYHASQFVEQALYPDEGYPRKPIDRVTLVMPGHNLTGASVYVSRSSDEADDDYVVYLSPSLMWAADADDAVSSALYRAMARLWLWPEGQSTAPEQLVESIVDYLTMKAGFRPLSSDGSAAVPLESNGLQWTAAFLEYCAARRNGFVARLNRGLKELWTEFMADDALGEPVGLVFAAYRSSLSQKTESLNSTSAL